MKNYILLGFVCIFLSACNKKYDGFDMIYRRDFPKAIPSGASTFLSHYFIIEDIAPLFKTKAVASGTETTDVKRIIPRLFRIAARFGDSDLSFIREVAVNIYPHNKPNEKKEIFYRVDVPFNTGTVLDLNPGTAEVTDLLSNENATYDLEVKLLFRSTPPITVETVADFSFFAVTNE